MKSFCFVLIVALTMPGCMFSKTARSDRYYYKQLKEARIAREKRQKRMIEHQRAEEPGLRDTPPPLPVERVQQAPVQASAETQ